MELFYSKLNSYLKFENNDAEMCTYCHHSKLKYPKKYYILCCIWNFSLMKPQSMFYFFLNPKWGKNEKRKIQIPCSDVIILLKLIYQSATENS